MESWKKTRLQEQMHFGQPRSLEESQKSGKNELTGTESEERLDTASDFRMQINMLHLEWREYRF